MAEIEESVRLATLSNEEFGFNFFKTLSYDRTYKLVLNPLAIQSILGLFCKEAKGDTAKELAVALNISDNLEILKGLNKIGSSLNKNNEFYKTGNMIFIDNKLKLTESFANNASEFAVEIETIDISEQEKCIELASNWIKEKTSIAIENYYLEQIFKTNTVMPLISVSHFKGSWKEPIVGPPFLKKFSICLGSFYCAVLMPFICFSSNFAYCYDDELDAQILELPLHGDEYSLIIILPYENDKTMDILKELPKSFNDKLHNCNVEAIIPEFNIEMTHHLDDLLKSLGIHNAFDKNADFPGIGETMISTVVQTSQISIESKETRPAAEGFNPKLIMDAKYSREELKEKNLFIANHPYIYMIRHKTSEINLFVGRENCMEHKVPSKNKGCCAGCTGHAAVVHRTQLLEEKYGNPYP